MDDPMMAQQQGAPMPPQGGGPSAPPGAPAPGGMPPPGPQGAQPLPEEGPNESLPDGDLPPEIQAEFERGMEAVSKAIYQDEALSDQILAMVSDQEKIGSLAKATVLVITEVDKKIDLDEPVLIPMAVYTADRLMELVEADSSKGLQYDDQEVQQVILTVVELAMTTYGVSPEEAQEAGAGMSDEDIVANHTEFYGDQDA